jgi:hypothetical protein
VSPAATYDLDGFIDTLLLLVSYARARKLVAASINLDPTGLGHYAYKLVDGTDTTALFDLSDVQTPTTEPGRGQEKK